MSEFIPLSQLSKIESESKCGINRGGLGSKKLGTRTFSSLQQDPSPNKCIYMNMATEKGSCLLIKHYLT